MGTPVFYNNLSFFVMQDISPTDTVLKVLDTQAIPTPTSDNYIIGTLCASAGEGPLEIIHIIGVDSVNNTLTIVRAQESTPARSFLYGASISCRITANPLNQFLTNDELPPILAPSWVSVLDYGAKGDGVTIDNVAIQNAIDACPIGSTVLFPNTGNIYVIDTSGGLTSALSVPKSIHLKIDGHLKATTATMESSNPNYIFNITSNQVTFEGSGIIEGSGAMWPNQGSGSDTLFPGLLYVNSVDEFEFTGIHIVKHPKIGIHLINCTRSYIHDCEFIGGLTTFEPSYLPPTYTTANPNYVGSHYVGIQATGGGYHNFDRISFLQDSSNGRQIECFFTAGDSGSSNYIKVTGCFAQGPWEKFFYGHGDSHIITNNLVTGTVDVDTHTDQIRLWGSNSIAGNNVTINCRSGVQALDGAGNLINDNQLLSCRGVGINIQHLTPSYTVGIGLNTIRGNIITRVGTPQENAQAIIIQGNNLQDVIGCEIDGNLLSGSWGTSSIPSILLLGVSPAATRACRISNNSLIGCTNGIQLQHSAGAIIEGNEFYSTQNIAINIINNSGNCLIQNNHGETPGSWFLSIDATASGNRFLNNTCFGATNIGIQGIGTSFLNSNYGMGNQYTLKPLVGEATCAANTLTVVTHGGVSPEATINIMATSQTFSVIQASAGFYTSPSSGDIAMRTGNGGATAGTEVFRYEIIQ